jgi:hypothetical protein
LQGEVINADIKKDRTQDRAMGCLTISQIEQKFCVFEDIISTL